MPVAELIPVVLYTGLAGACILLGGLFARIEHIHPRWLELEFRHFVIAFGGGVLLAAVALVLIPEATSISDEPLTIAAWVIAGGIAFFALERALGKHRKETPQFSAMLLDYLPESLALGGMFAAGAKAAPLLALLIGLQNLPEGFNAYRELRRVEEASTRRILWLMASLILLGPFFALAGWFFLSQHHDGLSAIMLFASGGILYLIFQDIAPQSRLNHHWAPPLGAVLGFGLALYGKVLVEHLV